MDKLLQLVLPYYPKSNEDWNLQSLDRSIVPKSLLAILEQTLRAVVETANELRTNADHIIQENFAEIFLQKCDTVLDYTWEQFHTGTWKDVSISWRQIYSYGSLCKAFLHACESGSPFEVQAKKAIKACDMGLIMGAPILDNILTDIAKSISEILAERSLSSENVKQPEMEQNVSVKDLVHPEHQVEEYDCPSVETFLLEILPSKKPVIIRNAMEFWPALSKWSFDYLRRVAGFRTVPVEIGSKYTDETWSQTLITVNEFIDKYVFNPSKDVKAYLAQYQLFDQIPQLNDDIVIPDYCYVGDSDEVQVNVWFGPKGTISPLHQDPDHNFLCQVVGSKYIRLYSEDQSESLYPHEGLLSNTSQVDAENPDLVKFPLFSKAPYWECVLSRGSMLYIPPRVWHYVRSLSESFSVSFWWK